MLRSARPELLLLSIAAAALGAACQASSLGAASPQDAAQGTCPSFRPPAAPSSDPTSTIQDFATASELAKYDSLIGRYLRGEVTVYRGTASGQATAALNDSPAPFQAQAAIPDGPALARLEIRNTIGGDWFPPRSNVPAGSRTAALVVHSLSSHLYIAYGQDTDDPDVTWAGFITSDDASVGISDDFLESSCSGCAPSFWERPGTIAFDGLATTGTVQAYEGGASIINVPVSSTSTVQLAVAAPCDLTWQDLTVLNTATGPNEFAADTGLRTFDAEGGLMVAHDVGGYLPVPPARGMCELQTNYTVDLWVDPSDLSSHGVRNFMITSMTSVCPS